jgi:uncharacterized phiE125 gp8 family phage protein
MLNTPIRTVAPATTPVTLSEIRAHCRVDGTDSDAVLSALLAGAVDYLDGYSGILGRALVTQTWRQDFAGFDTCLRLALRPVASIASVTYYDADGVSQTLAAPTYALRSDALGAYVALGHGQSWPSVTSRDDAVSVTYIAGTPSADVPAAIKAAIVLRVQAAFDPPSDETGVLTRAAEALESPYRLVGV